MQRTQKVSSPKKDNLNPLLTFKSITKGIIKNLRDLSVITITLNTLHLRISSGLGFCEPLITAFLPINT